MALLFSTTATPYRACTNTVSESPNPKTALNSGFLTGPFILLDANSSIIANTVRKLRPYGPASVRFFGRNKPVVVCFSRFLARAYIDSGSENNPDLAGDVNGVEDSIQETYEPLPDSENEDNRIQIEIDKTGKNSRRIRSKVAIQASLQVVWDMLTDYERLADFIPGLAVSKLLDKGEKSARLYQIGEQNLAFGLKFKAKGTIECFEKDLETLPSGQKRDIEFKMVEGDFQLFEGVWSIEQSDCVVGQGLESTLVYIVNVKPKVWLPVGLVEGRLCDEIRSNLSCIREEAEKAAQNPPSEL